MLEVEVKYQVTEPARVVGRVLELGGSKSEDRIDEDHYYNAPDRDYKQTDEAVRLRRIGTTNRLTYKGPKRDAATKTRTEIEVPLGEGEGTAADMGRLLMSLGYRPVAVVRKHRTVFHLMRSGFTVEVCVDDVDHVGAFVELEIVAEESRFEDAKAAVLALAVDLGLSAQERRSYLELLLSAVE